MTNSDELKEKVRELYTSGMSAGLIADALWEEFGERRSRSAVIGIANRLGLCGARKVKRPTSAKPNLGRTGKRLSPPPRQKDDLLAPARGEPRLKVAPPVLVAPPPALEPQKAVSLFDLEAGDCRFIIAQHPARFCGRPVAFGTPYCAACAALVYSAEGLENLRRPRRPSLRRVA